MTLLTPAAVAVHYGVHPATVRRWLADGTLRGEKVGPRAWLVRAEDLAGFQPPARGPRPAADRRRLLDQAREMVDKYPTLLQPPDSDLYVSSEILAVKLLAKQSGNTRERAQQMLARAIRLARHKEK